MTEMFYIFVRFWGWYAWRWSSPIYIGEEKWPDFAGHTVGEEMDFSDGEIGRGSNPAGKTILHSNKDIFISSLESDDTWEGEPSKSIILERKYELPGHTGDTADEPMDFSDGGQGLNETGKTIIKYMPSLSIYLFRRWLCNAREARRLDGLWE